MREVAERGREREGEREGGRERDRGKLVPRTCWGTSLIRNSKPRQDHRRALGTVLLLGPRRVRFLMSEVSL